MQLFCITITALQGNLRDEDQDRDIDGDGLSAVDVESNSIALSPSLEGIVRFLQWELLMVLLATITQLLV